MDMKKLKKWQAFQATKPLPPMTDAGRALMNLPVGESMVTPWTDERRPQGPGEVQYSNRHFRMEPTEEGLKFTRLA